MAKYRIHPHMPEAESLDPPPAKDEADNPQSVAAQPEGAERRWTLTGNLDPNGWWEIDGPDPLRDGERIAVVPEALLHKERARAEEYRVALRQSESRRKELEGAAEDADGWLRGVNDRLVRDAEQLKAEQDEIAKSLQAESDENFARAEAAEQRIESLERALAREKEQVTEHAVRIADMTSERYRLRRALGASEQEAMQRNELPPGFLE